ncbi:class I SAM-dependent DNA methyltransferase [Pseudoalteromonas sp. G4]|uniref:class I SAM-dependent DNA methyltransferase n=1 Tax=Pseudoalteromonas sp. G4 TaxID=2992761 RepID=UPI00237E7E4E|nr:class I SAM-dependent methyltransferase [Pseudoalteromonas sp. G4]MDE3270866.1 class I SAM-dependent methyltransferase [Pseudoalteromonas sp. G4]
MSNSWDEYADGWDTNEDVMLYAENAFKSLRQFTNLSGMRVLDFGCGTGLLTEKIAQSAADVIAIDTSAKMIDVLNAKSLTNVTALSLELSEHEIKNNPLLREGFDLIVASSVCAFVPDYQYILALFKRLLKQNGTFVQWDWQRNEQDDFGFTPDMISQGYENANLLVENVTNAFSLTSNNSTMQVLMGIAKNN